MTAALALVRNDDAPFQVLPPLTDSEYDALRDSIRDQGVLDPITVDEDGRIIDGHHRARAAAELGVPCPSRTLAGLTEAEKVARAIAVNVKRRQLSTAQKREVVAASLRAQPNVSDAEHARRVGVSDKTVTSVRAGLVAGSEIPNLPKRDNPQGRPQPATKPDRYALAAERRANVLDLTEQGYSPAAIATKLDIHPSRVHQILREQQTDNTPEPPKPKSREGVRRRWERAAQLAATGHTSPQIAAEIGMTEASFREGARSRGLTVPADAIVGKTRRIDPNRIVESIVSDLEAIPQTVELIDFTQLDVAQLQHWTTSLTDSIRALNRLNQKLNKQMKEMVQ